MAKARVFGKGNRKGRHNEEGKMRRRNEGGKNKKNREARRIKSGKVSKA